jgi:hypothetical protein
MDNIPDWWRPFAAGYPHWEVWQGVDFLYYGRLRNSSPPIVVRGEDPEDLRDVIRAAIVRAGL